MTASDPPLASICSSALSAARENSPHCNIRGARSCPARILKRLGSSKGDKPFPGAFSTQFGKRTRVLIFSSVNWSAKRRIAYAVPPKVRNGCNSQEIIVTDFTITYVNDAIANNCQSHETTMHGIYLSGDSDESICLNLSMACNPHLTPVSFARFWG